jgi:branched-chain amino acid transport system ATP-binding protein
VLRVERLTAGYGQAIVVRDATFTVPTGTVRVVSGPNGAGKTTLLHAIAGLVSTRDGTVRLQGVALHQRPAHRVARAGVALVPQGRRVFGSLTVAEHLALASRAPGARRRTGGWPAARVLDTLPALRPLLGRPGRVLSGGEQQMVAIGRALATDPTLLLLDEPTEGLAPSLAQLVTALLADIAAQGMTVLATAAGAADPATIISRSTPSLSMREHA